MSLHPDQPRAVCILEAELLLWATHLLHAEAANLLQQLEVGAKEAPVAELSQTVGGALGVLATSKWRQCRRRAVLCRS